MAQATRPQERKPLRVSRTYVVCEGDDVVACYRLSAGSVDREAPPGRVRRNAPDAVLVSIIGRLAVDRICAGRELGAALLADALRRVATASRSIGIGAVLVQAKDEADKRFHMACAEFIGAPSESRTPFLPIDTVVAAFG